MAEIEAGQVWLVGAGPGDPDLLTRKAERLINAASVVFHDALVGPGILALIPADIRRVSVGKRSGRHSRDQAEIGQMLAEAALAGERVVRLKGGDPSIFGRAAEEIDALEERGIDVRICPGVTAASAAAASAGISLTLRGVSRRLVLATAHVRKGDSLDLDWQALADPHATLAIYMGKAQAGAVARQLREAGLAPDTPVLLAENVSLPGERLFPTRLDLLPLAAATALGEGPALILIGDAVRTASDSRAAGPAVPTARSLPRR